MGKHENHRIWAEQPSEYRERVEARYPLRVRAFLTSPSGEELMLDLRDISASGFAARSLTPLLSGSRVFLALPGMRPAEAEVVWNIGCAVGGRFLPKLPFSQLASLLQELGDEAVSAVDLTGRIARGR